MNDNDFDLLQPNVFDRLRDLDWFINAISIEYRATAHAYDSVPVMARERLIQAFDIFWNDADGGKVKNLPQGTASLDQFKLSAYLCFWLRRINPIREIRPLLTLKEREDWITSDERLTWAETFILYGNEITAIGIAVKLAQYLSLVSVKNQGAEPMWIVKEIDKPTIVEFAKILKHKNISAHGINMGLQLLCGVGQSSIRLLASE